MSRVDIGPEAALMVMRDWARNVIEAHVESVAAEREYSSAAACAGYAASTVPQWAAEATAFIAWRDAVWTAAFAMQTEIAGGNAAPPASAEALIAMLPVIDWPAPT